MYKYTVRATLQHPLLFLFSSPSMALRLASQRIFPSSRSFSSTAGILNRAQKQDGPMTHFGFTDVPQWQKESLGELLRAVVTLYCLPLCLNPPQLLTSKRPVGAVFSSVAASYDTMNDVMSLGIHRLWKDHFVRSLNPGSPLTSSSSASSSPSPSPSPSSSGWNILDVAGGTGDIAFRMLDHATQIHGDRQTRVTIADINADMLAEGRKRSLATPYHQTPRLAFLQANAERLPAEEVPDNSVDLYTVAFGIRNFTDKQAALAEAFRVLKPGGVFACMEFSTVVLPLFDSLYRRWCFSAIPMLGQLVAGDRDSYQYLVESIERFPSQEEFRSMIEAAGFMVPGQGYENLTGGIAAIHKGVKPLNKSK